MSDLKAWKPVERKLYHPTTGKEIPLENRNPNSMLRFPEDPKEITPDDIKSHPLYQQMVEEARAKRAAEKQAAQEAEDEAAQARSEEAQIYLDCVTSLLDKYEHQRTALHEDLGAIWRAADAYEKVAGHPCPALNQKQFLGTHLPPLTSNSNVSSTPTTRVSVLAYQASLGKTW